MLGHCKDNVPSNTVTGDYLFCMTALLLHPQANVPYSLVVMRDTPLGVGCGCHPTTDTRQYRRVSDKTRCNWSLDGKLCLRDDKKCSFSCNFTEQVLYLHMTVCQYYNKLTVIKSFLSCDNSSRYIIVLWSVLVGMPVSDQ